MYDGKIFKEKNMFHYFNGENLKSSKDRKELELYKFQGE